MGNSSNWNGDTKYGEEENSPSTKTPYVCSLISFMFKNDKTEI